MAKSQRLRLNFKLNTNAERAAFLEEYLASPEFTKTPPNEEELELMANYLLWGKDPTTGLNAKQTGLIDIATKHGTWDKTNIDSLEGLMESPTFDESAMSRLGATAPIKVAREVFSRKKTLAECPEYLRETYTDLFRRIDETELAINWYELDHGKRKNPPRDQLLRRITPETQEALRAKAAEWTQYYYLKQRHYLVELRREQYAIRDSYTTPVTARVCPTALDYTWTDSHIGYEVEVLPLGLRDDSRTARLLFLPWLALVPSNFAEEEVREVSSLYWRKQSYAPGPNQLWIDFREEEHIFHLFDLFFELDRAVDATLELDGDSQLRPLLDTLIFYTEQAELDGLQREVLDMKMRKVRNADVARAINKKYGKNYTDNYISTIFRQRIIPKIAAAAKYHERLVSSLPFKEEFKKCSTCGRVLLRDPCNFTRKARSKDGLTARCKECEKAARKRWPSAAGASSATSPADVSLTSSAAATTVTTAATLTTNPKEDDD